MYESNTERLLSNGGQPFDRSGYFAEVQRYTEEAKRVAVLHRLLLDEMDTYETIPLWEGEAPGWMDVPGQRPPRIAFFPGVGGKRSGCVIVSPGGGYNCICAFVEGYPIIRLLVQAGISCALLDYRVKPFNQYVSVGDIQRAIRLLRAKVDELNILPDRIAVHGSSAGGNLSCMAAVHYDAGDPNAQDPVERMSSRPDAAVISYGVFSASAYPRVGDFIEYSDERFTYESKGEGLVSPIGHPDQRHRVYFSAERHVTPDTPPFFLWQTSDEDDPRQLFNLGHALADCGVRFEMHIFPYGPHGMGIAQQDAHVAHWTELAIEWLKRYGFDGGDPEWA